MSKELMIKSCLGKIESTLKDFNLGLALAISRGDEEGAGVISQFIKNLESFIEGTKNVYNIK